MSINAIAKAAMHGLFTCLLLQSTAAVAQNYDGQWSVSETVNATACGEGTYVDNYSATVSQTGSSMSVTAGNITRSGAFSGNRLTFSVSYPEQGGTNSGTGTITFSGNTASGNSSWTWSNGSTSCSGTSSINATRSSTPTPTPTPTPEPEPTPAALGTPVLSYLTTNTVLDVSWTSVPEAHSYTLFYAPYPAADPILTLDLGLALNASGQLALGNAFYIAIQANFADGRTTLSNIENFAITGVDSVDVTDPASDISSIIYGSNGSSLVTLNSSSTTTQAVLNFKDGKQGIMTGDSNGQLTQLSVAGFNVAISYGGGSKQITITAPDGSVSVLTESALVQASLCVKGSDCQYSAGILSALEIEELGRFERLLDDTLDTFRRIPTVLFCSQPVGVPVCGAIEAVAEYGSKLKERLSSRVENNISRIGNALSCTVSAQKCSEIAATQAPALVQQLEGIGTASTRPSAGFDIGAQKVTPKDSWRDYLGDGSFTMTDVPCAQSVFADMRPDCGADGSQIPPTTPDDSGPNPDVSGGAARCVTYTNYEGCFDAADLEIGIHKAYVSYSNVRYVQYLREYNGLNQTEKFYTSTGELAGLHYYVYVDGKWLADGTWESFDKNGTRTREESWTVGKRHGITRTWTNTGVLTFEGNWVDNKADGTHKFFYSSGTPAKNYLYDNGNFISQTIFN